MTGNTPVDAGSSPAPQSNQHPTPAELIDFALDSLGTMQLRDKSFCLEVHRDRSGTEGRSALYTIMVGLGLASATLAGYRHPYDVEAIAATVLDRLDVEPLSPGQLGLALWLDLRLGGQRADTTLGRMESGLAQGNYLKQAVGMEIAWMATGAAKAVEAGHEQAQSILDRSLKLLLDTNRASSELLYHCASGPRRRFPNFATQIYSLLALANVAKLRDDPSIVGSAELLARRVIGLQRPNGGWPWIYHADRGVVVEPYEIYSVHQDAMAPMALLALYEATGNLEYVRSALRGLSWIGGQNELGVELWDRERGLLYRSIRRKRGWRHAALYLNSAGASLGRAPWASLDRPLEVNYTDRPYHLGWLLEAWTGREHLAESIH